MWPVTHPPTHPPDIISNTKFGELAPDSSTLLNANGSLLNAQKAPNAPNNLELWELGDEREGERERA